MKSCKIYAMFFLMKTELNLMPAVHLFHIRTLESHEPLTMNSLRSKMMLLLLKIQICLSFKELRKENCLIDADLFMSMLQT